MPARTARHTRRRNEIDDASGFDMSSRLIPEKLVGHNHGVTRLQRPVLFHPLALQNRVVVERKPELSAVLGGRRVI